VQAHGWYGFLHLTLQEHFAATALLEEGVRGVEMAVAARYEPWWEEVILLLAGSLADASPLLLGVLQLGPGPRRTKASRSGRGAVLDLPDDDLFHADPLQRRGGASSHGAPSVVACAAGYGHVRDRGSPGCPPEGGLDGKNAGHWGWTWPTVRVRTSRLEVRGRRVDGILGCSAVLSQAG
jgi:hypothetical protein